MGLLDRLWGKEENDPVRAEAAALYAALREETRRTGVLPEIRSLPSGEVALDRSRPEVQSILLQLACAELREPNDGHAWSRKHLAKQLVRHFVKRKVLPPGGLISLLDTCTALGSACGYWMPVNTLLSAVAKPPTPDQAEALERFRRALHSSTYAESRKFADRIAALLDGTVDTVTAGGTWSARVLADIARFDTVARDRWNALLLHLRDAGDPEPSKRWVAALSPHVETVGGDRCVELALDWIALGPMPDAPDTPRMPERDADYLKGCVWLLCAFSDARIPAALADLAEQCFRKVPNHGPIALRVGNACIRVLARRGGIESLAQLGRLRARVKYATALQLVERALSEAASAAGITPEELEELSVPTFDLDPSGMVELRIGDYTARVRIAGTDDVTVSWVTGTGREQKGIPKEVKESHRQELARVRKTAKDIAALLPAQRARLERLLESDRPIPFDAWRERYPRHPLVGELARRLIWRFTDSQQSTLGAMRGEAIVDAGDRAIEWLSPATIVGLWHPINETPAEILAWRQWLDRHHVSQPFKQAHREIYLLTDAERTTRVYSHRFAAHVIRQHQFAALCRERGWQFHLMGQWDSHNTPTRALARWSLTVQFWVDEPMDQSGVGESGVYSYITTDQVRFVRDGEPMPLDAVPPLVFSEAMRDVDLFVGVCSVGNDPTWGASGDPPREAGGGPPQETRGAAPNPGYAAYWEAYSFGKLSELANTRRSVLAALIPKLKIAPRLSLEERFLVVRGDLATYNIHLGSTNVLMEPGSRYLCIVPGRGAEPPGVRDVWLPFEGDRGLAIIVSKAMMLASDTTITDPLIVSQIGRVRTRE